MSDILYDDTYQGDRYTYGLTFRPLAYGACPQDFIAFSDRHHPDFRHGTVQYPRKLTAKEEGAYQLTYVGHSIGRAPEADEAPVPPRQTPGQRFASVNLLLGTAEREIRSCEEVLNRASASAPGVPSLLLALRALTAAVGALATLVEEDSRVG